MFCQKKSQYFSASRAHFIKVNELVGGQTCTDDETLHGITKGTFLVNSARRARKKTNIHKSTMIPSIWRTVAVSVRLFRPQKAKEHCSSKYSFAIFALQLTQWWLRSVRNKRKCFHRCTDLSGDQHTLVPRQQTSQ